MRRIHVKVRGMVQGVGFRYFTRSAARRLAVDGFVRNMPDGSVELEAQGEEEAIGRLIADLRRGPSASVVEGLDIEDIPAREYKNDFDIRYF